jgi:hypothetical protein
VEAMDARGTCGEGPRLVTPPPPCSPLAVLQFFNKLRCFTYLKGMCCSTFLAAGAAQ